MDSRAQILKAISKANLPSVEREVLGEFPRSDSSIERFGELLRSIGGQLVVLDISSSKLEFIAAHPAFGEILRSEPESVYAANSIGLTQVHLDSDEVNPKEFKLSILEAEFCVAENGALWVRPASLRGRLAMVSTEHLVIFSPAKIVATLHEAYSLVDIRSGGYFLSGPSKTADIEQNLVIGAQGARTLTVVLSS